MMSVVSMALEALENGDAEMMNLGFCVACGAEAEGVEPDARNYKCEECGKHRVFGCEQIILEFA